MKTLLLADIRIDAGTQVRASIDQQVVADYAEAMTTGAVFPPIVVFHDGSDYHLADGFHRVMAATRLVFRDIAADVRPGTKQDALWFALGANRANGQRLTERDVRHAIEIALITWPDRSGKQLSEQIGCSQRYVATVRDQVRATANLPDRVTGKDGKTYPARRPKEVVAVDPKREAIAVLVREGKSSQDICSALQTRSETVANVRRELGVGKVDTSRDAVKRRRERMREMAAEGYTSRQIAAELELSDTGCRVIMRDEGIDVPADKATKGSHRHDSNRIVERMVMDAENLTEGANLIEFADLDRERLAEWLRSLAQSRDKLGAFIRRLTKEQQRNGEAA